MSVPFGSNEKGGGKGPTSTDGDGFLAHDLNRRFDVPFVHEDNFPSSDRHDDQKTLVSRNVEKRDRLIEEKEKSGVTLDPGVRFSLGFENNVRGGGQDERRGRIPGGILLSLELFELPLRSRKKESFC